VHGMAGLADSQGYWRREVSLSVITSRPWRPWPQIHWVVRIEKTDDGTIRMYEDYELVWPWMRCVGIGIHKGG
jgi:hypothetical protein